MNGLIAGVKAFRQYLENLRTSYTKINREVRMTGPQANVVRVRSAPISIIALILLGILIGGIGSWVYYNEILPSPNSRFTVALTTTSCYNASLEVFPSSSASFSSQGFCGSNTWMATASWVQLTASRSSGNDNLTMDIQRNGLVCVSGTGGYQVTGRCLTSPSGLIR